MEWYVFERSSPRRVTKCVKTHPDLLKNPKAVGACPSCHFLQTARSHATFPGNAYMRLSNQQQPQLLSLEPESRPNLQYMPLTLKGSTISHSPRRCASSPLQLDSPLLTPPCTCDCACDIHSNAGYALESIRVRHMLLHSHMSSPLYASRHNSGYSYKTLNKFACGMVHKFVVHPVAAPAMHCWLKLQADSANSSTGSRYAIVFSIFGCSEGNALPPSPPRLSSNDKECLSTSISYQYQAFYNDGHYCCNVQQAIEVGKGAGDDWAEFKYRHRQAEEDSHLLYSVLQQAEAFHQVPTALVITRTNSYLILVSFLTTYLHIFVLNKPPWRCPALPYPVEGLAPATCLSQHSVFCESSVAEMVCRGSQP